MLKKIFLILLVFVMTVKVGEAAGTAEVAGLRYSYGSGTVRIVLDVTKKIEFKESYAENPSRLVIDIQNAILSSEVQRNIELESTAAKRVRIAQFNPTTVRLVVETMADTRPFLLEGGSSGYRLVVDVGNADFKENPELNKKDKDKSELKNDDRKVDDKKSENKKSDKKKDDKKITDKKSDKDKKSDEKKSARKKKSHEVDQPFSDVDKDLNRITGLKGKKIVIDPGHGGNDAGAIGPSGVMEKTVTLRVSLELAEMLEEEGAEVILTRHTDRTVAEAGSKATDIEELQARCDVANEAEADIFISIHADSFTNPASCGTTGYYYSGDENGDSKDLADCIRRNLCEQLGTPSRGTQPCNFYVVRHTDMPATLIELAFISNPEEEEILSSREGAFKAAQGIFDGIEDYFG